MLVLTRGSQESITIYTDPPVRIMLIGVNGNQARIGIEAPKDILILRDEVEYRKKESK